MLEFPEIIDSTMLAAWKACPQKYMREHLQHWKPKEPSVHLHAGAAYARGLEVARRSFYELGEGKKNAEAAGLEALMEAYGSFSCPPDSAKSLERMCGALEFYFDRYPLGEDPAVPLLLPNGKRAVEFSFAIPLNLLHPVTGNPILYAGRCDQIVEFAGGLYTFDDKTCSQLGASWSSQWNMRGQFIGYTWAAQQSGITVSGTIVRGVSILKTRYDTAQALVNFSPLLIERWEDGLYAFLHSLKRAWERANEGFQDKFSYNLSESCTQYGGCPFVRVCSSPDPEAWLEMGFERRVWNPLTRIETKLPEEPK